MNITICKRDRTEGKAIRNWERQCFPCIHARLVKVRSTTRDDELLYFGGIYLFQCPHVGTRHRIIGKDTHESHPRSRIDLIEVTSIFVLSLPKEVEESLNWQELQPPFAGYKKTEIAEISREQWAELLGVNVSSPPQPCICGDKNN